MINNAVIMSVDFRRPEPDGQPRRRQVKIQRRYMDIINKMHDMYPAEFTPRPSYDGVKNMFSTVRHQNRMVCRCARRPAHSLFGGLVLFCKVVARVPILCAEIVLFQRQRRVLTTRPRAGVLDCRKAFRRYDVLRE